MNSLNILPAKNSWSTVYFSCLKIIIYNNLFCTENFIQDSVYEKFVDDIFLQQIILSVHERLPLQVLAEMDGELLGSDIVTTEETNK